MLALTKQRIGLVCVCLLLIMSAACSAGLNEPRAVLQRTPEASAQQQSQPEAPTANSEQKLTLLLFVSDG